MLSGVWLCDPMDCSIPGFPIHHQLLELAQTHAHWVSEAIQPSRPLLSPSPSGVGFHALLQRIFPTQGSNPGLPRCRWIFYQLRHQGSLHSLEVIDKDWLFTLSLLAVNSSTGAHLYIISRNAKRRLVDCKFPTWSHLSTTQNEV